MHDLDQIRAEELEDFEDEDFEEEDFEDDEDEEFSSYGELSEEQELELAAELLEVDSEEELEEFLGKLFKKIGGGIKKFARSGIGKALGRGLKSIAKTALPIAGSALGNLVAPGVGGMIGGKLGSLATKLFEIDAEAMSEEEMNLEAARKFVRLAVDATKLAAKAPPNASPKRVAKLAIFKAAKRHAPGLLRRPGLIKLGPSSPRMGDPDLAAIGGSMSGRWIRRGRKIILLGA